MTTLDPTTSQPLEPGHVDDEEQQLPGLDARRAAAAGAQYEMAGKSGTAQVFTVAQEDEYDEDEIEERLRDHALFVAFAPIEDPQIAVAVIVENGSSGSRVAAPIARTIMDHYLLSDSTTKPKAQK